MQQGHGMVDKKGLPVWLHSWKKRMREKYQKIAFGELDEKIKEYIAEMNAIKDEAASWKGRHNKLKGDYNKLNLKFKKSKAASSTHTKKKIKIIEDNVDEIAELQKENEKLKQQLEKVKQELTSFVLPVNLVRELNAYFEKSCKRFDKSIKHKFS